MADTLASDEVHATDLTDARGPAGFRPSLPGMLARIIALGIVGVLVVASPYRMEEVQVNVLSGVATFAIIALSLNVLIGYTGQVSLGHSAFLGMGAFTSGFILTELQMPWEAAVIGAILLGGVQALLIGFVALRVRGLYLALVTLVYAVFAERVLFNIEAVTRGGAGMPANRPFWAEGDIAYAYVCIAAVALVWVLDWRLTASKAGRAIEAIRDSERVAASWGINVTAFKLFAFVLSGMIAGLGGALFASIEQIVSPLDFGFLLSLTFLLMAIFGGVGSRPGVVLGAVVFAFMATFLDWAAATPLWPSVLNASAERLVSALLVLVVLLFVPGGLAQLFRPVFRWLSFGPWRAAGSGGGPGGPGGGDARP